MKRVGKILINVIFVFILFVLGLVLINSAFFGGKYEIILSESMEPAIHMGSYVMVIRVNTDELKVGDIISFQRLNEPNPFCHRIAEIIYDKNGKVFGFMTKGDAVKDRDSWVVKPEDIRGKAFTNVPYFGYLIKLMDDKIGRTVVAVIISMFFIGQVLWDFLKRKNFIKIYHQLLKEKPSHANAYWVLLFGIVLMLFLGIMMGKDAQERSFGSFIEKMESTDSYAVKREVENKGKIPLIVCYYSDGKSIAFSENPIWLAPKEKVAITISGEAEDADAKIISASYFPMLPKEVLFEIFLKDYKKAPYIVCAIWLVPITLIAFIILFITSPKQKTRAEIMKETRRRVLNG